MCSGAGAGRAISSPGVGGITIFHRRWVVCVCVCVCVCVSKGLGGDNTVEIQVRIPAGICDGDLCVRIVMASLLVLKSSLGSALSGCEALAGFFPPLPQFSHQENGV